MSDQERARELRLLERQTEAAERQADAMESFVEELQWQSAILTELAWTQYLVAENSGQHPGFVCENTPSDRAMYTNVDDHRFTREEQDDQLLFK